MINKQVSNIIKKIIVTSSLLLIFIFLYHEKVKEKEIRKGQWSVKLLLLQVPFSSH